MYHSLVKNINFRGGKGRLNSEGGLINFLPLRRGGGLVNNNNNNNCLFTNPNRKSEKEIKEVIPF